MTDRAAFLRAIRDDPDNDEPRLVYADWLEEQGDPRAEFIRLQCEIARQGDDTNIESSKARADELLKRHLRKWQPCPRKAAGAYPEVARVERGFHASACMSIEQFVKTGSDVVDREPVHHFILIGNTNEQSRMAELASMPAVEAIRWLEVSHKIQDEPLAILLGSPHLAKVRRLLLRDSRFRKKSFSALADADFPELEWLDLRNTSLPAMPVVEQYPNLMHLDVSFNVRVNSAEPLAHHPAIETVNLRHTRIHNLAPLASLSKLKHADLCISGLTDLSPLVGHSTLETIDFSYTPVTDLEPLFSMPNLREVSLLGCRASEFQIDRLVQHLGGTIEYGRIRPRT